jgi:hypothetical protein
MRICGFIVNEPSPVSAVPWNGRSATPVASRAETANPM